MGHRIPLHGNASTDDLVRHRQHMVNMARPLDVDGNVAGFRPQYMEYVLVAAGHAEPSLLDKPRSDRSKKRQKAKEDWNARYRATGGYGRHRHR